MAIRNICNTTMSTFKACLFLLSVSMACYCIPLFHVSRRADHFIMRWTSILSSLHFQEDFYGKSHCLSHCLVGRNGWDSHICSKLFFCQPLTQFAPAGVDTPEFQFIIYSVSCIQIYTHTHTHTHPVSSAWNTSCLCLPLEPLALLSSGYFKMFLFPPLKPANHQLITSSCPAMHLCLYVLVVLICYLAGSAC